MHLISTIAVALLGLGAVALLGWEVYQHRAEIVAALRGEYGSRGPH